MEMLLHAITPDGLFETQEDSLKFWVITSAWGEKYAVQLADSPEMPQFAYILLNKESALAGRWLGSVDLAVSGEPGGSYTGRCGFIVETGGRFGP